MTTVKEKIKQLQEQIEAKHSITMEKFAEALKTIQVKSNALSR